MCEDTFYRILATDKINAVRYQTNEQKMAAAVYRPDRRQINV